MSDWKPGDVAIVLQSGCERIAFRNDTDWIDSMGAAWDDDEVTKYGRPIVALDPEDREAVERLDGLYWATVDNDGRPDLQAALREFANPKPPKPDEPQGLGAVVEDADGYLYIRTHDREDIDFSWSVVDESANKSFRMWKWESIDVVRVLSEGVRP